MELYCPECRIMVVPEQKEFDHEIRVHGILHRGTVTTSWFCRTCGCMIDHHNHQYPPP